MPYDRPCSRHSDYACDCDYDGYKSKPVAEQVHDLGATTPDERRAIATLKRLAKKWPRSLWLFSANGRLHVMRYKPDGTRALDPHLNGSMDQKYSLGAIEIPNDGGDW